MPYRRCKSLFLKSVLLIADYYRLLFRRGLSMPLADVVQLPLFTYCLPLLIGQRALLSFSALSPHCEWAVKYKSFCAHSSPYLATFLESPEHISQSCLQTSMESGSWSQAKIWRIILKHWVSRYTEWNQKVLIVFHI